MLRPFAIGAVLGSFFWPWCQVELPAAVAGAVGLAACAALTRREPVAAIAFGLSGVCFGFALLARLVPGPQLEGAVQVRGIVATAAEGRRADVELSDAGPQGAPPTRATGRVRVVFPERPPPPGTAVLVAGTARRVDPTHLPGQADPVIDAARSAIRSVVSAADVVRLGLPRPAPRLDEASHAALLRALVDGETGDLDAGDVALLKRTGTWHLVSISGIHVGIGAAFGYGLAWLFTRPLAWFRHARTSRLLCALGGIAGACGYAELADWGVPARRAVWMATATLLARAGSRSPEGGRTLAFAAVAVLVADPTSVGSLGFQLSFLAMLGMLVVGERVTRLLPPDLPWTLQWLGNAVAASLGATVGTLPVVALHIQSLSPLSPLANLWAVPWIGGLATPLAVLATTLHGLPRLVVLSAADAAVDLGLGGLRLVDVAPMAPAAGAIGAFALAMTVVLWRRVALGLGLTGLILCWPQSRSPELVVTFLAVGQGDATLVEWPDGRTWLVDGGPPGEGLVRWLRARGIRALDAVFLSHGHPDHFGGLLPVLRDIPVATLVSRELVLGMDTSRVGLWDNDHPALLPRPAGYDDSDENNRSLVLRIAFGSRTFLLPGDAELEEESAFVTAYGAGLHADVLKLGHHGSRTSSSEAWLKAVRPELAVAECGFDNRYRHPNAEPLRRLHTLLPESKLWRTDRDGSVEVRTDGHDLRVRTLGVPARWRLR